MKTHLSINNWLAAAIFLFFTTTPALAIQVPTFNINLNFSGLNTDQQAYFSQAANFWKSVITGYAPSVTGSYIDGVTINASASNIDGIGGTLGSAGPQTAWGGGGTGGYVLAQTGIMSFDLADINNMMSNGTFTAVIQHEMAHVLGFGTLWTYNGVYANNGFQYTGQYGLAAYQAEFNQPSATYIPVEQAGGAGTANGHWNEVDNGSGPTGITDNQGRDMTYELMTGWLNTPASKLFVSNTTIQSFRDLGYSVANLALSVEAVPLPGNFWMFASALMSLLGINAKMRKSAAT